MSFKSIYVYPKVRVRQHQQENHISPQNDHTRLRRVPVTKASDESQTISDAYVFASKEVQGSSLPLRPKIMKAAVLKVPAGLGQSLSSSKVGKIRHLGNDKHDAKPEVRACSSAPRPRAVLSSPENDGMIGLANKLFDEMTPSAVKVEITKERVPSASQRQPCKTSLSPMSMTKDSIRAVSNSSNGLLQCKVKKQDKKTVKQMQASAGIGKPSFPT